MSDGTNAPRVLTLSGGVRLEVWPEARHCRTVFHEGGHVLGHVPASPHDTAEYLTRARALGYTGTDADAAWACCVSHEWAHSSLAGPARSPTLLALAQGKPAEQPVHYAEEARVLLFQKALNDWRVFRRTIGLD